MKILLVGINAKYVQTNLAIRLLRAFASAHCPSVIDDRVAVEIAEWNINLPVATVVRGVYESCADMVLFSTYIWNRDFVLKTCSEIRSVCPEIIIGLGGPEVSWSAQKTFESCAAINMILAGEGEQTFAELVNRFVTGRSFSGIKGVYWNDGETITYGGEREVLSDLSLIPFPYGIGKIDFNPENRIVYYESSRGCPFSCAYCLSSIDKSVRYYPLERVLGEIGYFMDQKFPLVKFVDRTFNLDPARYLSIWKYIRDHYNGRTLFHFEIAAEYLAEEAYAVLGTMPECSIQFEIGIQSINQKTLQLVRRPTHTEILAEKIKRIPSTIHTHVDLIAGLPAENLESFAHSFNFAFSLDAGMLQLGFLKVLAGSAMEKIARELKGYICSSIPPYEVLASPDLPYKSLLVLKDIEQVLDTWYNSGLLRNTLKQLLARRTDSSAFALFQELSEFIRKYFPDGDLYLPRRASDIFGCMAAFIAYAASSGLLVESGTVLEWLKYDLLLQGKPGSFPAWYARNYSREEHDRALISQSLFIPGESRRTLYARTEFECFMFGSDATTEKILFVYSDSGIKKGEKRVRCIRL